MKRSTFLSVFAFFVILSVLLGCSAEKNNIFSKAYHNTTAHFNAYFIAREHIREVEEKIWEHHEDNYNEILQVLPDIDTAYTKTMSDQLEDVIVKASLPIQLHKNSQWVDDSYTLIGKARLYLGEYTEAIETFKYVNTNSEENDTRHRALVALMRTFIEYGEYNNAVAVSDYLKKEKINDENKHDLFLVNAYLYQLTEDYQNMMSFLREAIELSSKSDHLARKYFIAGQVYQKFGYDSAAYSNYQKCLRSNPHYELSFYAKLNMAQVTQLARSNNVKKVRKYFKKLIRDKKNREYRDKIYYELARFELKQQNQEEAIEDLKTSVRYSVSNQRQKAYSFLKIGEIYYDHYKNFRLAKSYYDSVMSVLPQDDERYESIKERQNILTEFVKNYNIIYEQDSLLELANMNDAKLDALLEEVVLARKAEEERLEKEKKKEAKRASPGYTNNQEVSFNEVTNTSQGGVWYFYNPAAVSSGRNEFLRKWGDRRLEDNWRRSNKSSSENVEEEELADVEENHLQEQDSIPAEKDEKFSLDAEKQNLMSTIPFSEEEKQAALNQIEVATYNLGNIYNFKLQEKPNAIETFEGFIKRFPESEYKPEVLYQLYLLYKAKNEQLANRHKEELLNKYPDTDYAKLILNPNFYEEQAAAENRLQQLYDIAFEYFNNGDYDQADLLVSRALRQYPDNPFSDHLRILDIMITAKTDGIHKYQYELQQYIENHEESKLKEYAEKLLAASKKLQDEEIRKQGIKYISDLELEHFYILTYKNDSDISDQISEAIDQYIKKNYQGQGLNIGSLKLDEETNIILVNQFDKLGQAKSFMNKINGANSPLHEFEKYNFEDFIITKENFEILFKRKALKEYKEFYKEYYK